jgi:hypothetical protein
MLGLQIRVQIPQGRRREFLQAVDFFSCQPFGMYNLAKGWYFKTDMIVTANWDAPSGQKWTVPFGGGVGKLFTIGKQPINANLQAYYMVETPDLGPEWNMSLLFTFLFPKKSHHQYSHERSFWWKIIISWWKGRISHQAGRLFAPLCSCFRKSKRRQSWLRRRERRKTHVGCVNPS